jgi:hypothetical protein
MEQSVELANGPSEVVRSSRPLYVTDTVSLAQAKRDYAGAFACQVGAPGVGIGTPARLFANRRVC